MISRALFLSLTALVLGQFTPLPTRKPPVRPTPAAKPTPTPTPGPGVKPTPTPGPARPTLLWRVPLRRCDATPVVEKDGSFIAADRYVHHLDDQGRTVWFREVGPTQSELGLDARRVFVGTERGTVYALDRRTGTVLWKAAGLEGAVRMAPAAIGSRLVVECLDGTVYGLDTSNGSIQWQYVRPDSSLGYAAPTVGPVQTVVVSGESTTYCLDGLTGQELWTSRQGGKSLATAAISGKRVYVAGDGAGVSSLDRETGERRWRFRGDDVGGPDWYGVPLVVRGTVYVASYRRYVYALDATNGKTRWVTRLQGPTLTRPALDEKRDVLYLTSGTWQDSPTLTALNAKTGVKFWELKLGFVSAAPVIADDRLYIASTNGYFYAFSLR